MANTVEILAPQSMPAQEWPEPPSKRPSWKHQKAIFWTAKDREAIYLAPWMRGGKSKSSIDIINARNWRTCLIVCPATVVGVWPRQFELNSVNEWVCIALKDGTPLAKRLAKAKLQYEKAQAINSRIAIIINHEAAWRGEMGKWLRSIVWDAVICDEAHRGKRPDGKFALWLMGVKAKQRLALSGTPLPHSPLDVWSQFMFLDRTIYGPSYFSFKNKYAVHAPQLVDRKFFTAFSESPERRNIIKSDAPRFDKFKDRKKVLMIGDRRYSVIGILAPDTLMISPVPPAPVMGESAQLGREINSVVGFQNIEDFNERFYRIAFRVPESELDLPPDIKMDRTFELDGEALKLYRDLETKFYAEFSGGQVNMSNALVRLLRLQQITSGFVRNTEDEIVVLGDHKEKALADVLEDIDEPAVVVCRFRHDLDAVHRVCAKLGKRSGEISGRRHDLTPESTMPPDLDVEATQIQAGGTGIDLSRAPFVIYYSVGTNLGDFEQVRMRAKGSSQTKSVTHIALKAENTVDIDVYDALSERKDVIEAVLSRRKA